MQLRTQTQLESEPYQQQSPSVTTNIFGLSVRNTLWKTFPKLTPESEQRNWVQLPK